MRCAWVVLLVASSASADVAVLEPAPPPNTIPPPANTMPRAEAMPAMLEAPHETLRPQLQIDGGLSVIGPAYEHPITARIAVALEAFVFGTYFLPWFDAGADTKGFGAGLRGTWFSRAGGRGLYVTPYFRVVGVDDTSIPSPTGIGFTTGAFVGWAFGLGAKLDLRVGAGAQYIHFHAEDAAGDRISASTPFVAIDALLGYRL